jgi:hypothetical protein
MMGRLGRHLMAALLVVPGAALAASQPDGNSSGEAFSLLNQPTGARAFGMGSAFVAVADDDSGQLWNPAAPGLAPGVEAGIHHDAWLDNINRDLLSLQLPVSAIFSAGFFGGLVNYPALELRGSGGAPAGTYSPQEHLYALSLALHQTGLSVGLTGRYMDQSLPGVSQSQTAWDWGLLWDPTASLRVGTVLQTVPQVGGGLGSRSISGASLAGTLSDWRWRCAGSGSLSSLGSNELDLGLELSTGTALPLAVRAGFSREFPGTGGPTDQRLSVGFGLGYKDLVFDYAFLPWGDFGASNRLSLRWLQRWQPGHDAGLAPEPDGGSAVRSLSVDQLPLPAAGPSSTAAGLSPGAGAAGPAAQTGTAQTDMHVLSDLAAQGRALQDQGRDQEALQAYQAAVRANPADLEAWRGQARIYHRLGREADARRCWQRLRSLDAGDPEAAAAMAVP